MDQDYTIMEGYELPSKGLIYDKPISANFDLRCLTGSDELKLLASTTTQFKLLAEVIESCLIDKPAIHVYDMALGDYEYLLQRLRVVTYGPEYKMWVKCPHCGKLAETVADLDQLTVIEFTEERQQEFNELRTVTLPDSGDVVRLNFKTPRMLDTIANRAKELSRRFKDAELDFNTLVELQMTIAEVNGKALDPLKSENYIKKLSGKDMFTIINRASKLNNFIGVDTTLLVDCGECGGEIATRFQYGPEFLKPTTV